MPVEELANTRTWLKAQPGVDAEHVALWGVSKGAELARVGAAQYSWVNRVIACVPSSAVWEGFGRCPIPGEVYSSWSIDGKGLAYVPYDNVKDANDRKFPWAFVHARSLAKATPEQHAAARIPLEKSSADILLLAATNDVVWPSGVMADEIERRFRPPHISHGPQSHLPKCLALHHDVQQARVSTDVKRLIAHDEYGLALLNAHQAKPALAEFSEAIRLATQVLHPTDPEVAYIYLHRAAADTQLADSNASEQDLTKAKALLDALIQEPSGAPQAYYQRLEQQFTPSSSGAPATQ